MPRGRRCECEPAGARVDLLYSTGATASLLSFHRSVLLDDEIGMHVIQLAFEKIGKHRHELEH